ncbi:hypothetical protein ETAA8_24380 [Anatilimnocola aggregata]|uniref:Uncharacterized protein n=1 Tax=Anatilimnocola aggregata TaxID=2528021 RepID=A0A517YAX4_9BACT|nr:hypothetical protein [Anatilimnocola aggregata]QDU27351.1 hypothetical protein ETAA8_24380 [Anatilimnocola aggregata]
MDVNCQLLGADDTSYLLWFLRALGIRFVVQLLMTIFSLTMIWVLLRRGKSTHLTAALLLLIPLPLDVTFISEFDGFIASMQVIALSGASPTPEELAAGGSMSLAAILTGMCFALPGFLLAITLLVIRALTHDAEPRDQRAQ